MILLIFLGSWRSTIVVTTSIPQLAILHLLDHLSPARSARRSTS